MKLWDRFVAWLNEEEPPQEVPESPGLSLDPEVERYLQEVDDKLDRTVQDLADGLVNRAQFENLYRHYQNQRRTLHGMIAEGSGQVPGSLTAGESMVIRQKYAAKVLAYAVYDNESSVPLYTVGNFPVESDLVVGFLSGFRSAAAEILGAGAAKAEAEDGKVLCYVPGDQSTLIVLYSSNPAEVDVRGLRQVHQHFETLNARLLEERPISPDTLLFNYDMVLKPRRPAKEPTSSSTAENIAPEAGD
jgi:hypothetical protein